jgi:hypothetical protein
VTGRCEHGDEPAGSGATDLVSYLRLFTITGTVTKNNLYSSE